MYMPRLEKVELRVKMFSEVAIQAFEAVDKLEARMNEWLEGRDRQTLTICGTEPAFQLQDSSFLVTGTIMYKVQMTKKDGDDGKQ